jgi:hypothetical protein
MMSGQGKAALALLCVSAGATFLVLGGRSAEPTQPPKQVAFAEAFRERSTKEVKALKEERDSLNGNEAFRADLRRKIGAAQQELVLLAHLRQLKFSDPERSIRLAERLEQSFPGSESSPERAWYQARNLVYLKRFDEARQIARQMHEERPDDPWAQDLRRHLLSHPFGLPPRDH